MMHEREKSDPAIVAGKPTNKADATVHAEHGVADATEPVEPRAGAEGNASQQSTHRAQDRKSVSKALERAVSFYPAINQSTARMTWGFVTFTT